MIASGYDIVALDSREQFERYVAFGADVYGDNSCWVPPDPHHFVASLAGEIPAASHCELQPFWASIDDRILATATALIDKSFNAHWNDSLGHVLFFEALPGQEEAALAVLHAACDWLRKRGCTAARFSFLYGWQLPLTIDAYDAAPTTFHTYNPPYYHRFIKDAGFETESGQIEYRVRFTPELTKRYEEMAANAVALGVTMRPWDLSQPQREASLWAASYNEAFTSHWGAPQFEVPEMEGMVSGLTDVLPPEFTVFAEADGRVVGSVFAIPDFNQLLRGLDAIDHGVLLVISVTPAFRGRGLNLAMAARSYLGMIRQGCKSASYTTVLDTNWPSRRTAEKLGARVARNFVVYRRNLA